MYDITAIKNIILRCIFPRRCVFCDEIINIEDDIYVCADCLADDKVKTSWVGGELCEKCGKPIEFSGLCKSCQRSKHRFDRAYAVYPYEDDIRLAVHRFKYSNRSSYARFFGREMAKFADKYNVPLVDYVVPVPLHKKRLKKRGYNQSALLADVYCEQRGQTRADLLERVVGTKPQNSLDKSERTKNMKNVFSLAEGDYELKGKSVLLIDDIFTTGTTVDECTKVLKKAGIKNVYVLCLSISLYD